MIAQEPKVQETGRYSINETCQILEICRSSLKKYTDAGFIKCGFRRHTYKKFYKGVDILAFWKAEF